MRRFLPLLTASPLLLLFAACGGGGDAEVDGSTVVIGAGAPLTQAGVSIAEQSSPSGGAPGGDAATNGSPTPGDDAPTRVDGEDGSTTIGGMEITPAVVSGLNNDPSKDAQGKIEDLVTFGQLSLTGVDLDQLLDYLFKPESASAKTFEFPESITALDDKDCALVGYMIPLEFRPKTEEVIIFMLVRDLASCCFGGSPRPDEWIYVEMAEGKSTKLFPYVPIVVRGELDVGRIEDEFGFASGVYTLEGQSVERYE